MQSAVGYLPRGLPSRTTCRHLKPALRGAGTNKVGPSFEGRPNLDRHFLYRRPKKLHVVTRGGKASSVVYDTHGRRIDTHVGASRGRQILGKINKLQVVFEPALVRDHFRLGCLDQARETSAGIHDRSSGAAWVASYLRLKPCFLAHARAAS